MTDTDHFRVRPGRLRDRGARSRSFVGQALQAARRAGHLTAGGSRGPARRGRGAGRAAGLRSPARRVMVKARVVRHGGRASGAGALAAHIGYLRRDGVDRRGGAGALFGPEGEADGAVFAAACEGDRHHFRFIVSPEDAAELASLPEFTRDLMRRMAGDLGTRLDWLAVAHWNTAHPHVHILVRGIADDGADLVIAGDYLSRGVRARAEALVSLELGPRSAREIAAGLQREASAERWTGLDRMIAEAAPDGRLDLRPGPGAPDHDLRPLLIGRAVTLERLGLARAEGVGVWRIDPAHPARLRELAERVDIIAALHRAVGTGRAAADLAPYGETAPGPILGRLADRGLHDELTGRAYVVIDGADGRVHHVQLPDLAAAGDTPIGGLVEAQPGAGRNGAARLVHRSDLSITAQVAADGATWLDRQLLARAPAVLAENGFGNEVRVALEARGEHLARVGLACLTGGRLTLQKNLLATLRAQDLAAAGARLSHETGLRFEAEPEDPQVRGRYVRRIDLASGRFAMVEDGLGFRLAPWARALDRQLGQTVSGVMTPAGMEWSLGRGLER